MYRLFDDENEMYWTSYDIWCQIRCNFIIKQSVQNIGALIESISKWSTVEFEIEWTKWLWIDPISGLGLFEHPLCFIYSFKMQSILYRSSVWMLEKVRMYNYMFCMFKKVTANSVRIPSRVTLQPRNWCSILRSIEFKCMASHLYSCWILKFLSRETAAIVKHHFCPDSKHSMFRWN